MGQRPFVTAAPEAGMDVLDDNATKVRTVIAIRTVMMIVTMKVYILVIVFKCCICISLLPSNFVHSLDKHLPSASYM